jgi:hypothetical protein
MPQPERPTVDRATTKQTRLGQFKRTAERRHGLKRFAETLNRHNHPVSNQPTKWATMQHRDAPTIAFERDVHSWHPTSLFEEVVYRIFGLATGLHTRGHHDTVDPTDTPVVPDPPAAPPPPPTVPPPVQGETSRRSASPAPPAHQDVPTPTDMDVATSDHEPANTDTQTEPDGRRRSARLKNKRQQGVTKSKPPNKKRARKRSRTTATSTQRRKGRKKRKPRQPAQSTQSIPKADAVGNLMRHHPSHVPDTADSNQKPVPALPNSQMNLHKPTLRGKINAHLTRVAGGVTTSSYHNVAPDAAAKADGTRDTHPAIVWQPTDAAKLKHHGSKHHLRLATKDAAFVQANAEPWSSDRDISAYRSNGCRQKDSPPTDASARPITPHHLVGVAFMGNDAQTLGLRNPLPMRRPWRRARARGIPDAQYGLEMMDGTLSWAGTGWRGHR